jgi:hypothetical protein
VAWTLRRPFLTVYDYGQGGVWLVLLADSQDQITDRYPELQILKDAPSSMSEGELEEIRARRTLDIDDETDPFLASLREGRDK